jgi:hypothetical protein
MTSFSSALRFLPAGPCGQASQGFMGSSSWAPDAATEYKMVFGGMALALAGAGGVVLHALSAVAAFQ